MNKRIGVIIGILFLLLQGAHAQFFPITEPDKSPLDVSYFPNQYPLLKLQNAATIGSPKARVIYSRPQKNGRTVFGEVARLNEIWRLGANENTEIEFFTPVQIGSTRIAKGRYAVFAIPQVNKWTIIINRGVDSWGAFSYQSKLDLLRLDVNTSPVDQPVEYFTMLFDNAGSLVIAWDNTKAVLPIKYLAK